MKRRAWRGALALVVLGIAVTALALSAGPERRAAGHDVAVAQAGGIEPDAPQQEATERTRERTRSALVAAPATFGPHVGTGTFQGESPVVADLPVVQAPIVTQVDARDSEQLGAASGSASNAKDPVVQKKKGTGSLSAPLTSFDGICLPFGPPCAEGSACSCLPPDTNGDVVPGGPPLRPRVQRESRDGDAEDDERERASPCPAFHVIPPGKSGESRRLFRFSAQTNPD